MTILRIQLEPRVLAHRGLHLEELCGPGRGDHRAEDSAGLAEQLDDILVAALQRRYLRRIAATTGARGMLGAIHSDKRCRIDLVRGHWDSDAVSEFHHPLLLQVRQTDIALYHIELQILHSLQFHLEVSWAGNRDTHLVIGPHPFKQPARSINPRAGAHAGCIRLPILGGFVGSVAGTAYSGDPEREPGAALSFAKILL